MRAIDWSKVRAWLRGHPRRSAAVALVFVTLCLMLYRRSGETEGGATTFVARRGPLAINVLEGGSIEAKQAQEIRSEIKGHQGTKILSIVEEGSLVTEEDVQKGRVLVELDSSDLRQRITQQDIQYQSALANYIDARQALEIQINQSKGDIKLAEQKAKFALMEFERYMGDTATRQILVQVGLSQDVLTNEARIAEQTLAEAVADPMGAARSLPEVAPKSEAMEPDPPGQRFANGSGVMVPAGAPTNRLAQAAGPPPVPDPHSAGAPRINSLNFDFTAFIEAGVKGASNRLGDGAAQQELRKYQDALLVARTDLNVEKAKLEGTRRLYEKRFVPKTELETDEIRVQKGELGVKAAETALELFKKYEFAKTAEKALSDFEEALRGLERTRKEAVSRLAQSRAKYRSAEGQYQIQDAQRKELAEQLDKCVIKALKPGLVVYGGSSGQRFYNPDEQIREGATVRERQPIITIPDMSQLSVKVKIPEAHIKRIRKGMKARVQVDAFPDQHLAGEVTKVGVLPDSQDRWLNPDLKVYQTTIGIEGTHDWIKPGMSAKVEIQVKQLEDVVYVPVQAIIPNEGRHYCYVGAGRHPEWREVEIGDFNDEFVVVKSGLNEGDVVQLRSIEGRMLEGEEEAERGEKNGSGRDEKPATPAASPAGAANKSGTVAAR